MAGLFYLLSFTLSLYFLSLLPTTASRTLVGVTYTTSHQPSLLPDHVAKTIDCLKISAVHFPESDPAVIRAFSYSNTSLLLSIPNTLVPSLAANRSNAVRWLYTHVLPFYPRAHISTISVGSNIFHSSPNFTPFLLPAITNVRFALHDLGISKISVSTTFSFVDIISTAFPPSSAQFQEPAGQSVIRPLLQFLEITNSSFLINLYPYNLYRLHCEIPIGFALFQEHAFNFRDDLTTGVRYWNLFDMMVDAVISAMAVVGHENVPIIVSETGWPSSGGDATEVDATPAYAEIYFKGLMKHLRSGLGTPLRKQGVAEAYIYELFDKEVKVGTPPGRNWGILYPNMTRKYRVEFSSSAQIGRSRDLLKLFLLIVVLLIQWLW